MVENALYADLRIAEVCNKCLVGILYVLTGK